jgi:hypothetical protein
MIWLVPNLWTRKGSQEKKEEEGDYPNIFNDDTEHLPLGLSSPAAKKNSFDACDKIAFPCPFVEIKIKSFFWGSQSVR